MPPHLCLKIDRFREQLIVESTRLGDDKPFRSVTYPRAYIVDLYDWILQAFPFEEELPRISGELPEDYEEAEMPMEDITGLNVDPIEFGQK